MHETRTTVIFHMQASILTKPKLWFWIVFAVVEILSVSRTIFFLAKISMLEGHSGSSSQTSTTLNTNEPSIAIAQPLSSVSRYEINQTLDSYTRFASIIRLSLSFLHWIEYIFLAQGSYHFLKAICMWKEEFRKKLLKKLLEHMKQHILAVVLTTLLLVFFPSSLAAPIVKMKDTQDEYNSNREEKKYPGFYAISNIHYFLTIFAHIFTASLWIAIVIATLTVHVIWSNDELFGDNTQAEILAGENLQTNYWETAVKEHCMRVTKYEKRREKVIPILKIFESWFVIQWIIYYVGSVLDLAYNIRPWIGDKEESLDSHTQTYMILYLICALLAFIIPHVCGLRMNVYHREYYKKITEEQENNAQNNQDVYRALISNQFYIKKQESCDFVPYISWLGMSIPVDGPGYLLTVLLTFFAFVGNFSL